FSITTLRKQRLDLISGVVLFQSPAQVRLPVRLDERECQNSARCEARAQLFDEILRLFPRRVRKDRVSEYEIKLNAQIRHRQIDNALGIERTVEAVIVKPIRLRKCFTTFFNCVTNYVETVIILVTDRARRIEQQVSLVPTEIKHALILPVRMIELCVKIGKLRRLHELRTHRSLFFSSSPEVYFLDHHKKVLPQRRKAAKKISNTTLRLCVFAGGK